MGACFKAALVVLNKRANAEATGQSLSRPLFCPDVWVILAECCVLLTVTHVLVGGHGEITVLW